MRTAGFVLSVLAAGASAFITSSFDDSYGSLWARSADADFLSGYEDALEEALLIREFLDEDLLISDILAARDAYFYPQRTFRRATSAKGGSSSKTGGSSKGGTSTGGGSKETGSQKAIAAIPAKRQKAGTSFVLQVQQLPGGSASPIKGLLPDKIETMDEYCTRKGYKHAWLLVGKISGANFVGKWYDISKGIYAQSTTVMNADFDGSKGGSLEYHYRGTLKHGYDHNAIMEAARGIQQKAGSKWVADSYDCKDFVTQLGDEIADQY